MEGSSLLVALAGQYAGLRRPIPGPSADRRGEDSATYTVPLFVMGCPVASPVVPHNFRRFLIRQDIGHPACLRPFSRMRGRCAWFAGLRAGKLSRRRCDLPTDPGWYRFADYILHALWFDTSPKRERGIAFPSLALRACISVLA